MATVQVRALYDFDAQPGTGELTIKEGEMLTVIRRDVGEGWWEGTNSQGEAGLFPASYVEEAATTPPDMPPPPLPAEYANTGDWSDPWSTGGGGGEGNAWNTTSQAPQPEPKRPVSQQPSVKFAWESESGAFAWEGETSLLSGFRSEGRSSITSPLTGEFPWEGETSSPAAVEGETSPVSGEFPSEEKASSVMSQDDDWDDEWDDDDSETGNSGINGAGNFGLNAPNRSARPTSSVGDINTAGAGKASVDEKDKVFIDDSGSGAMWRTNPHEFTCAISSPKKESKFHGMKSFIAYSIMPSFSQSSVSRRYKHFDWIQARLSDKFPLIPIPPLPEKQISGRFEDDLIEYRMTMLQSWIDRICRHPVISQSEVFHHFVTCPNDEKKWKAGKRKAESDKLVGANFYLAIERPDQSLDVIQTEAKLEGYNRFFNNLDESVKLLQNTCLDQAKKHQTAYKREFGKISHAFSKLSRAFDTDPSNCAPELTEAIHHVSEAYSDIGTVYEEEPKHDWDPLCHLLFEYRGLIDGFPNVISATKGAIAKRRQVEKEANEGRLDHDQVPPMIKRSDTIAYALHAEVAHFHQERTRDFKKAMVSFLTEQINFYQKVTDRLRESLEAFSNV